VMLRPDETVTLVALERMKLTVSDAGLVSVSLNGTDETVGVPGQPHQYSFQLGDRGGGSSSTG